MYRLTSLTIGLFAMVTVLPANAIEPPSRKPPPTYKSSVLSRADSERVQLGLRAASEGDWNTVRAYREAIQDRAGQKLLLWREATSSLSDSDFETLDRALNELEGWPSLYNLRVAAEEEIADSALTPTSRILWL